MPTFSVKFAVYGALAKGNENSTQAINVVTQLQLALDTQDGIVAINNDTFGTDPSVGNKKHFGAIVNVNGTDHCYACEEGQTIDFYHVIAPAVSAAN
jgi:hypothetical protein